MDLVKKSDGSYALTIPEEAAFQQEQHDLEIQIEEAKKKLKELEERRALVSSILWKIHVDIPKSYTGWPCNMFMKGGKPVHVYELMPEGMDEFRGTYGEWVQYQHESFGKCEHRYLNRGQHAAHFHDLDRASCPKCGTLQPVIYDNGILSEDDIPPEHVRHIVICCGDIREVPQER